MNSGRLIGAVAVACLLLVGCAQEFTVVKGPKFDSLARASYMILPFGDTNEARFRVQYPNAASAVSDAFESAFIANGFTTIPCPEARTSGAILGVTGSRNDQRITEKPTDSRREQRTTSEGQVLLGEQGITMEQGIEWGRKAGADVVLFGTVTAFYRGVGAFSSGPNNTTVGFSVKAIDVKTSEIVWKASLIKPTKYQYNYEPTMYAAELANQLVGGLVGKP